MPNPPTHIDLALEGAGLLSHPVLEKHLGSFLLGCTAPDVRIITRGQRADTHFAPLSNDIIGTGAMNMFSRYPGLARASQLPGPTAAFIAGYISHLVSDETWIIHMYRPYFGEGGVFQDSIQGNIMDRALQLEMDQQAAQAGRGLDDVKDYLADGASGVEVEFLPAETLAQWQEWLLDLPQGRFSWERLRFMVRRQYPDAGGNGHIMQRVDRFIASLPQSLEEIFERVPREDLATYRQRSIQQWVRIAGEYLS
ncbi:MAG: zinc dependent phospholipase C family protein [Chloroflexi bacterium]|nr:zinc dependent phospholipase C family protein [Chloroflexota bacterium]